jgi:hypothetical protein
VIGFLSCVDRSDGRRHLWPAPVVVSGIEAVIVPEPIPFGLKPFAIPSDQAKMHQF